MDDQFDPITLPSRAERSHLDVLGHQVRRARLADAIASTVIACAIAVVVWSLL